MFKAFKVFTILAALALFAQPAFAQGTAPAAAPAAKPAPAVEKQDFNSWRLECATEGGKKLCQLIQQVVAEGKDKKKSMLLAVKADAFTVKDKSGKDKNVMRMIFITPLGTLLPATLSVKLDDQKAQPVPFLFCAHVGCIAEVGLDGLLLDKVKAGKKMTATYKRMNNKNQPITATISLNGLSAGLQAMAAKKTN